MKGISPVWLAILIIAVAAGIVFVSMVASPDFKGWMRDSCFYIADVVNPFDIYEKIPEYRAGGVICDLMFG